MNNIKVFNKKNINIASKLIFNEDLVAFATETVYGLGADARSNKAVSKIFKIKNRPDYNPLIVHVHSTKEAFVFGETTNLASKLAKQYWPGPLTLILKRKKRCNLSILVSGGLESIAIRVPKHPLFLELLNQVKIPIAAPSANKSGKLSSTCAEDVRQDFGDDIKIILDDGFTKGGLESTVIDARYEHPIILRPGLITKEMIKNDLNLKFSSRKLNLIESPGQLLKHYAPKSKLIINSTKPKKNDAFLTFKNIQAENFFGPQLNLSKTGNINEVASNLYKMLRKLDEYNPQNIVVAPIPNHGLGFAINNRLKRACN